MKEDTGEGGKLQEYLKENKVKQDALAIQLGYADRHGLLYHFHKKVLGHEFKMKLRGAGIMLFDENGKINSTLHTPPSNSNAIALALTERNIMEVPLVNQYAYAGYLSGFKDEEYVEKLPTVPFIVDKQYKGKYLCFQIRGDSMDDGTDRSYKEGSIALGRELGRQHWKSKFRIDRYRFVIVHRTEGILIKQIIKHDVEKGILTLHSYNPMYEDLTVKLDDVLQMFNVIKVIKDE
jgi:hypothetical protein